MCGRIIVDYDEMMSVAGDTALADWMAGAPAPTASSWNIAPTGQLPVAFTDPSTYALRLEAAHWSLVPPWAKQLKSKFSTFNVRSEGAASKPSFKRAVQHARCAIPISGFYEWTGSKSARVPHAIFDPSPIMTLAGLYSRWRAPDGEWLLTTTILTRASAGQMTGIHDRMPVFLAPELTSDWLDPSIEGDQHLVDAVAEAATPLALDLRIHEVRPLRGDGRELIDPAPR